MSNKFNASTRLLKEKRQRRRKEGKGREGKGRAKWGGKEGKKKYIRRATLSRNQ